MQVHGANVWLYTLTTALIMELTLESERCAPRKKNTKQEQA